MNIFDFAMQMEKEGEAYYRSLAQKSTTEGIKKILNMLADDEVKHQEILERLKEKSDIAAAETQVLQNAKNIFAEMKDQVIDLDFGESEINLYRKARELEEKSERFYKEKAQEVENIKTKEILLRIAGEENRHIFLIENMIAFLSRPQTWIENAEFYHLDEY